MKPKKPTTKPTRQRLSRRTVAGQGAISNDAAHVADNCMAGLPKMTFTAPSPFPSSLRTKLRYCENFSLTTGTGGIAGAVQQMRLNSLFDPNLTGTGHQPNGFDQLTPIYGRYRVDRVNVLMQFTTPGSTADIAAFVHIMPSSNTPSLASAGLYQIPEKYGCQMLHLTSSGSRRAAWSGSLSIATVLGLRPAEFRANPNVYAAVGANPSTVPLLEIGIASFSGASGEAAVVVVTMEFFVEFSDRVEPGDS